VTTPSDGPDFGLPADLRAEVAEVARERGVSLEWLVSLYRRGFAAKMGATGQHPYGKLRPDDEGELTVAMAVDRAQGVIRMEFGKPVAWLALPAAHARHLAKLLVEKADDLDRKKH
jgi:hypothetical protein